MSSPVATIGLTYDGVDIQDTDTIFLEISQGLFETGDTRGIDVTVPGRDGQLVRPRRFHQRKILLVGIVRGAGVTQDEQQTNFRTNLVALRSLFNEIDPPKELVALTEDANAWTIPARTIPDGRIVVEMVKSEMAQLSIELLALEDWTVEAAGS